LKVRLLGTGGGVAHTPATPPPPQICGSAQVPQPSHPPQPSGSAPHVLPWAAQVVGVQPPPQTLAVPPPPHVAGRVQVPQTTVLPRPSGIVPQFLPSAAHVTRAQTGGAITARYGASTCVVRFSAMPTMTVPSAETPLANTSCQLPVDTPAPRSTLVRFCIPRDAVQRNAMVRPPGGGGTALPTTTEPAADTPTALLQSPPSWPRARMPLADVQRNAPKPVRVRARPTTADPSDDASSPNASPPPRLPRFSAAPACHRYARL